MDRRGGGHGPDVSQVFALSAAAAVRRIRRIATHFSVNDEIKISFDEFGWQSLEERAAAERMSLEALLALALHHYDSQLESGRAATEVPRFRRTATGEPRSLRLEVDDETRRRLEEVAERRGVTLENVCEHAALLFLADLDAGRVAERIIREAGSEVDPPRHRPETSA